MESKLQSEGTVAEQLARFVLSLRSSDIPREIVERAKLHILDSIGVALASSRFDFARRALRALDAVAGEGSFPTFGLRRRLPIRDAALLNGILIHGLDFDDTHTSGVLHLSASVLPAVLGIGLERGCSGSEFVSAYIAGIETGSRLAMAARGQFHDSGFHPTGVVGVFAATLAVGRLLGMEAQQLACAQGIALSMAAGSLEFLQDGSWTKRMHPGWAANAAITACALAKEGFTGPFSAYEGRYGLYKSYLKEGSAVDLAACTAGLGSHWEVLGLSIKPYPLCHYTHVFADLAIELRNRNHIDIDSIKCVSAKIGAQQVGIVCEPESIKRMPENSYGAQFSLHYVIATALKLGRFTMSELSDQALRDSSVLSLCQRISYEPDPNSAFPRYYSGELIIEMKDGRVFQAREEKNRGSDARPLQAEEIRQKFRDNAEGVLSATAMTQVMETVLSLDEQKTLSRISSLISES